MFVDDNGRNFNHYQFNDDSFSQSFYTDNSNDYNFTNEQYFTSDSSNSSAQIYDVNSVSKNNTNEVETSHDINRKLRLFEQSQNYPHILLI